MAQKVLIIGAGAAALSAVRALRRERKEGEIKLVAAEERPLYSPTSLPYLLSGKIPEDKIWVLDEAGLRALGCSWEWGRAVSGLDDRRQEVVYHDGRREGYDLLLIASGSRPLVPPVPGLEEAGFFTLRTLSDCRRLLPALRNTPEIAIVGAGLIGMQTAAELVEQGYRVTIVEKEDRVLPLYFSPEVSAYIGKTFEERGAVVLTGEEVREVRREGDGVRLELAGGRLKAGLLLVAVGVSPGTDFLKGSGVAVREGILVDRRQRSSVGNIYAAGDVAEAPDFFTGEPRLNPILPAATAQGRVAGLNMGGGAGEYEGNINMNVFNFFGRRAFSVGRTFPAAGECEVMEVSEREGHFKRLVLEQGRLVGAQVLNEDIDPGILAYLISRRVPLEGRERLLMHKTRDAARWLMLSHEESLSHPVEL